MSDDKKVIFSMSGVTKTFSGAQTPVLNNIYLSFFYGAKIGILGLNGSGKSTLLKIIAGLDTNYRGDVVFSSEHTVGYLEQEPQLDETKTVIDIVREGAAETVAILDRYNEINNLFGLPEVYEDADKMQKLMDEQARLQDQIDASNAWELDTRLEIAMDALRTPEPETPIYGAEIRIVQSNEGFVKTKAQKIRMKYYDSCRKMYIAENRSRASSIQEGENQPLLGDNPSINRADGFLEYPMHLLPPSFYHLHLPGQGGTQSSIVTM